MATAVPQRRMLLDGRPGDRQTRVAGRDLRRTDCTPHAACRTAHTTHFYARTHRTILPHARTRHLTTHTARTPANGTSLLSSGYLWFVSPLPTVAGYMPQLMGGLTHQPNLTGAYTPSHPPGWWVSLVWTTLTFFDTAAPRFMPRHCKYDKHMTTDDKCWRGGVAYGTMVDLLLLMAPSSVANRHSPPTALVDGNSRTSRPPHQQPTANTRCCRVVNLPYREPGVPHMLAYDVNELISHTASLHRANMLA